MQMILNTLHVLGFDELDLYTIFTAFTKAFRVCPQTH